MSRTMTFSVLFIIFVPIMFSAQLVSADIYNPLLKVKAEGIYLTAGSENLVEITLNNTGDFSVYEVEAILSVPASTLGIVVIENGHMVFNEIENEKYETYNARVYVDSRAPMGTYVLNLQLTYNDIVGTVESHTLQLQIGLVVNRVVESQVMLNVAAGAAHLRSGDENRVGIVLENLGEEPLSEIDVTLTSVSSYIAILNGSRFVLSSLDRSGSATYSANIAVSKGAPIGAYTMTASVAYRDSQGKSYISAYTLALNVDTLKIAKQTTVVLRRSEAHPETVKPGGNVDLNLELACVGASAYDIKTLVSVDPSSSLSPLSPTLVALGDLNQDMIVSTKYRLLVDGNAKAGPYPVRITISYIDSYGVSRSLTETAVIDVSSLTEFSLLNVKEVSVGKGEVGTVEADLLLIGTESVKFIKVEVVPGSPFTETSKSMSYIGAVDPDSPTPFDVQFYTDPEAKPGDYALRINVTYYDNLNQPHSALIKYPVRVVEPIRPQEQVGPIESFWLWLRRLFGLMP